MDHEKSQDMDEIVYASQTKDAATAVPDGLDLGTSLGQYRAKTAMTTGEWLEETSA